MPADLQQRFRPATVLFHDLLDRFITDPASFVEAPSPSARELWRTVFMTWLHRTEWRAPFEIGAQVAMEEPDEDRLLGAIADFLIQLDS